MLRPRLGDLPWTFPVEEQQLSGGVAALFCIVSVLYRCAPVNKSDPITELSPSLPSSVAQILDGLSFT